MHTVRAGDTLYMLAKQYKVTLDSLMKANPNLDPYNLRVGMQLCIPTQENEETTNASRIYNPMLGTPGGGMDNACLNGRMYRTQRGDTLTRVLDRYEISFAALQSSNPNVDFTDSLEDMSLCIPSEDHFRTCPMSGAYIVKSGDTLDSISKKLLVITDSLLMANPTLTIEDFSIPGTKVCIPS
jgi:LysM repeat protein